MMDKNLKNCYNDSALPKAHMNNEKEPQSKYPNALSLNPLEGGYTFLHRVFRTQFETNQPVVIDSGGLYIQYKFEPHHKTFAEGLRVLEGDNPESWDAFMRVANNFSLDMAFQENNIQRPISETRKNIDDLIG